MIESDDRMTAAEIRRMYREAKDKPYQITILAEMNVCSRSDIKRIIDGETDELPPLKSDGKRGYTKPAKPTAPRVPASDDVKREIIRLNNEGCLGKDIAKAVGRSASFVSSTLKQYAEGKMIFAEEKTEQEREQLVAEITDKLEPSSVEVRSVEASAPTAATETEETASGFLLPEDATVSDIANALVSMLIGEFSDYIIEIKATDVFYNVRVTDITSGEEITHKKRRADL